MLPFEDRAGGRRLQLQRARVVALTADVSHTSYVTLVSFVFVLAAGAAHFFLCRHTTQNLAAAPAVRVRTSFSCLRPFGKKTILSTYYCLCQVFYKYILRSSILYFSTAPACARTFRRSAVVFVSPKTPSNSAATLLLLCPIWPTSAFVLLCRRYFRR